MVVDFYRPGSSWLHSFDARAKLILLAPAIASFFLPVPFWAVLPALAGSAIIIAITLGPGELLKPLRAIGPVLLLICLLTPPFVPEGKPLVSIFGLALITSTGLSRTFTTLTRFIGITLAFVAVFRSIEPDHLAASVRWLGAPYAVSLVFIIALRYIPSLGATWRSVQDAHKLRSAGASRLRARRRLFRWDEHLPVLTSVLIQAVKGIPALAMTLECRGFGRRTPRTSLVSLKRGKALALDLLVALGLAAILLAPGFIPWPSIWLP